MIWVQDFSSGTFPQPLAPPLFCAQTPGAGEVGGMLSPRPGGRQVWRGSHCPEGKDTNIYQGSSIHQALCYTQVSGGHIEYFHPP